MSVVATLEYRGSINNFRSLMDSFLLTINYHWRSQKNEILGISYEPDLRAPGREGWIVSLERDMGGPKVLLRPNATIFALETLPGITKVQFLDGQQFAANWNKRNFNDPGNTWYITETPIGESLVLLSKEIEKQWKTEVAISEFDEAISPSKYEPKKITPIEYPGSIAHFRARMDRFLAVNGKIFKVKKDTHTLEYRIEYYGAAQTTTREVWNVLIDPGIVVDGKRPGDSRFAMILAVEEPSIRTIIEFIDGHCYERTGIGSSPSDVILGPAHLATHEPIGDDFVKIAQWVLDALKENLTDTKIPDEPKTRDLMNDWFPYFHRYKDHIRITLRDIATKTNYNYDYVRQQHANYIKGLERE